MRVIGLTGGIATGKSTVAEILRSLGAPIVDADRIAHEVTAQGAPAVAEIGQRLGAEYLGRDGSLDRALLARRVFADDDLRRRLNAIVHPLVRQRMAEECERLQQVGAEAVVLDVPLLLEARSQYRVDAVWLVYAPQELQLRRLMARNRLSAEESLARIHAQMPIEEKRRIADVVIENLGDLAELRRRVEGLWRGLQGA